jgi:hypothetical protein
LDFIKRFARKEERGRNKEGEVQGGEDYVLIRIQI